MMASAPTPFSDWLDKSTLFQASTKFDIQAMPLCEVHANEAVHPLQRYIKTWTVSSSDPTALTKLRLVAPGLMIVRVNPQIRVRFGGDTIARVRVTSDHSRHIDCLGVTSKKRFELRVAFTNATDGESESDMGSLVTEIDLAYESQITEILAMGGGDVTVHGRVIANDSNHSVILEALNETKLSIEERQRDYLLLKELSIDSASGGEIFVATKDLTVLETFSSVVHGDGRIHVVAPRLSAESTQMTVVGEYGTVQIKASDGLATSELIATVLGSGYATIQSSSLVEIGRHSTCAKQDLRVEGFGRIDVAGVPCERARVKLRESGRAVIQPRHKLELDCSSDAVVDCVGSLPASIQTTSEFKTDAILVTNYRDRVIQQRVARAIAPTAVIPATPTVARGFETTQWLHVTRAGLRDSFLRPFFDLL